MTTPTRDEAMRQQFEAWLVDRRMSVERDERHGYYLDDATQDAWLGYQAALRSPAVAGLVEAARKYMNAGIGNSTDFYAQAEAYNASRAALAQYATLAGEKA